jgi:hypothetical protein
MRVLLTAGIALMLVACGGGGSKKPADSDRDGFINANDCAPNDAQSWQMLGYAAVDNDGDTFRANSAGQVCAGASLPANRFVTAVAAADADCNDGDASAWRLTPYVSRDVDGDGYRDVVPGNHCDNGTLPSNYYADTVGPMQVDCNDTLATAWHWRAAYADADGDGVGAGAAQFRCLGNTYAAGFSAGGYDPNDDPNDNTASTVSELPIDGRLLTIPANGNDSVFF